MGKTTDELVKMAYQVSPHPNRRELDMLLSVNAEGALTFDAPSTHAALHVETTAMRA
jgi:hypothetical protein